ncbi:MAG: ABC transporter permease subunit [Clostridiaceae bacterium]
MQVKISTNSVSVTPDIKFRKFLKRIWKYKAYYAFLLPAVIYVAIFNYGPLYGLQIAFKDFSGALGIAGSKWVGIKHFESFLNGYYFWTLIKNTFAISIYSLAVGFPIPIILALMLNEVGDRYKRIAQTVMYAPHFISTVVMVGIIMTMFSPSIGVVNTVRELLGLERLYFVTMPEAFRHLYVWSGVWQSMGWSAVIYIAALSGVDPELLEAATIDGAGRMQRIIHINMPVIRPVIVILFIMTVGKLASVGYEKIYLLQNDLNVEVSEVISTYVYKRGLLNAQYSFTSAVDIFNNVINVALLLTANAVSRKVGETSLF